MNVPTHYRTVILVGLVVLLAGCGSVADDTSNPEPPEQTEPALATATINQTVVQDTVLYNETLAVGTVVANTGDVAGNTTLTVGFIEEDIERQRSFNISANSDRNITTELSVRTLPEGNYTLSISTGEDHTLRDVHVAHPSPFEQTTVSVYVNEDSALDYEAQSLHAAVDYWNTTGQQYLSYPISLVETVDKDSADIVLGIESVRQCANETSVWGCADYLNTDPAPDQLNADVDISLTNETVYITAIHELGHTLGKAHGDAPDHMNTPITPIFERSSIPIYLSPGEETSLTQLRNAVVAVEEYFQTDAEIHESAQPTFEIVGESHEAAVIIETTPSKSACPSLEYGGVCSAYSEQYQDQQIMTLSNLDRNTYEWYIAYLFWGALTDRPEPPALQGDTTHTERENFAG